jgi:diguanylate cyclase (GGDEF)-like protein
LLGCGVSFGEVFSPTASHLPIAFVPFAFVIWLALRLDVRGASAGALVTALLAVWGTVEGRGPFGGLETQQSIVILWPFLGFMTLTALLLGASTAERRAHRRALEIATTDLDLVVRRRTAELEEAKAELERINQELEELATIDSLTDVNNRRVFDERLECEWKRALRNGSWLSLILIDIDFFKAYNDACGHLTGDQCLQQVAGALARTLKRPPDILARFGGEEFAIVLPETGPEGAAKVAEDLRASVEFLCIPHPDSAVEACVTISVGLASAVPARDTSAEPLLEIADQQLYHSKSAGRNQVTATVSNVPPPQTD